MLARLNQVTTEVTAGYKNYELDKASRPLEGLIDDISVWYLRRSRDRLKGEDVADKQMCLATLRYVLKNLALLMAPVMPFYAEYMFQQVKEEGDVESVHLDAWPKVDIFDKSAIEMMEVTRKIVTIGLEARTKANIKVRQPLNEIRISGYRVDDEHGDLIRDELNIKAIGSTLSRDGSEEVWLDTDITPELKQEGDVRELIRAIQDTRKKMGLSPSDRVVLVVNEVMSARIEGFKKELMSTVGADKIKVGEATQNQVKIDETMYVFDVVKIQASV